MKTKVCYNCYKEFSVEYFKGGNVCNNCNPEPTDTCSTVLSNYESEEAQIDRMIDKLFLEELNE